MVPLIFATNLAVSNRLRWNVVMNFRPFCSVYAEQIFFAKSLGNTNTSAKFRIYVINFKKSHIFYFRHDSRENVCEKFRPLFLRKCVNRFWISSLLLGIPLCISLKIFSRSFNHRIYTLYTFDKFFLFHLSFFQRREVNTRAENNFFSSHHLSECLDFCRAVIILLLGVLPAEQSNILKNCCRIYCLTFLFLQ